MRWKAVLASAVVSSSIALAGCGLGVDSHEEFQASIRGGASCSELFDQRSNFSDKGILDKIDADLADIGCDDPDSERTDR
ncbi:MAG TPA: hypothetical protein VNC78_02605 [Actinomycetota bacterium]|nr:hypothetical protein [Actinomycetota bacterium]